MKGGLEIIIIAAVSQNGVIGNNNKIPWFSNEEFQHFKKTTFGYPIIMGRKTFESIGQELPNRLNIIIMSNVQDFRSKRNLLYFTSVGNAYQYLRKNNYKKAFIGGGSRVYISSIKYADKMILSHMNFIAEGDIKFPKINMNLWNIKKDKCHKDFTVKYYSRIKISG